ncbi:hypothetical protein BDV93DRAFT_514874 [Ceratobasidium sp. AG-I]|nr:hypothetical protein BDV93DRAFT_514874 [Ceratobasidium sp. AG-I]
MHVTAYIDASLERFMQNYEHVHTDSSRTKPVLLGAAGNVDEPQAGPSMYSTMTLYIWKRPGGETIPLTTTTTIIMQPDPLHNVCKNGGLNGADHSGSESTSDSATSDSATSDAGQPPSTAGTDTQEAITISVAAEAIAAWMEAASSHPLSLATFSDPTFRVNPREQHVSHSEELRNRYLTRQPRLQLLNGSHRVMSWLLLGAEPNSEGGDDDTSGSSGEADEESESTSPVEGQEFAIFA